MSVNYADAGGSPHPTVSAVYGGLVYDQFEDAQQQTPQDSA